MSLNSRIIESIRQDGAMSVETFMHCALLDPEGGYYSTAQTVIGRQGDFITAPEISQCFGEMLGLWAVCAWQAMGSPPRFILAEMGAGHGTLMLDSLRAAAVIPAFLDAVEVWLIEASPRLREHQKETLKNHSIMWAEDINALPDSPLIVLGNEFLDALPIRQFINHQGVWHLRRIGEDDGVLSFTLGEEVALDVSGSEGDIYEDCPTAQKIISDLSHREDSLAVLQVDYGYDDETVTGDSFQAVKNHRYVSVLSPAGTVDLTAHVDFSALRQIATSEGAVVWGVVPQGVFLDRMGIKARVALLVQGARPDLRQGLIAGVERLLDDNQMGRLFKVIGFGCGAWAKDNPLMMGLFYRG